MHSLMKFKAGRLRLRTFGHDVPEAPNYEFLSRRRKPI